MVEAAHCFKKKAKVCSIIFFVYSIYYILLRRGNFQVMLALSRAS